MPINMELEEQLSDIADGCSQYCDEWTHQTELRKEKNFRGMIIEVDPEDAKTIEEVKSFKASVDTTVMEEKVFERKE